MSEKRPELLAPVGTWEMCHAAVHNGADAIYVGMPGFNARGRAETLSLDTLRDMITFCHERGVRVLVAFNVLIFQREIPQVIELLREVLPLNVDAFIVQDIGLVRLIHALDPHQIIHASTQMTITSAEAIACTESLPITRYVLGREVSLNEMQRIREATSAELEVFVHGALCVSYSGQCLTSESMGGRSANRGQCAQSCRLAYDLIVDGQVREMGERRYLVSPKDLCALGDVAKLCDIGIDSFKIEGRLKSPEYVAATVHAYRQQIDVGPGVPVDPVVADQLKVIYSRDHFNGWMDGVNHQRLVRADFSSHRGMELGVVQAVEPPRIIIATERAVERGDGVMFADGVTRTELGGSVYDSERLDSRRVALSMSWQFEFSQVHAGMRSFLNVSPRLTNALRKSFTDRESFRRIPISMHVSGAVGEPLRLTVRDDQGHQLCVQSAVCCEPAQRAPLTGESLRKDLAALSGTIFVLEQYQAELSGELFIHQREIKKLRQLATTELLRERLTPREPSVSSPLEVQRWITQDSENRESAGSETGTALLNVLVRDVSQLNALSGLEIDTVYLDFEFGRDYQDAVRAVREMGFRAGIATTRILKPGEQAHLKQIQRIQPEVILVRNLGALHWLRESSSELVGDFSLNVSNVLTAHWFHERGLVRLTPSYDLNQVQLLDLVTASSKSSWEVTVHHYIPSFHMEHCVFAAFMSTGTSYRDCGRPCEKFRVSLRDQHGVVHPLKADAECRNTMFNGIAQSAVRLVPQLINQGIRSFRLEALFETPAELREKVLVYSDMLKARLAPERVFEKLGVVERYGVSEGQLFSIRSYKDRKKSAHTERPGD